MDRARQRWAAIGKYFCVKLDDQTAKLRLFLCVPEARGLGLGKRLLARCMALAKAQRFQCMSLWTHESHEAACALYTRTGLGLRVLQARSLLRCFPDRATMGNHALDLEKGLAIEQC